MGGGGTEKALKALGALDWFGPWNELFEERGGGGIEKALDVFESVDDVCPRAEAGLDRFVVNEGLDVVLCVAHGLCWDWRGWPMLWPPVPPAGVSVA